MAAYKFPIALLFCVGHVGAVFRHAAGTSHSAGAVADKARSVTNAEEVRRVAGLLDVERDLETDKKRDDTNLRELETQIVTLVRKRDAAKRDEGRKDREIAFLQNQIGRARAEDRTAAEQESRQESKADLNVDAAIASADQVVSQAEAADTATQHSEEKVDSAQAVHAAAEAVAQRRAQEEAAASEAAAAAAATARAAAEKKAQEEAAAAAAARAAAAEKEESRAAFEARIRAEAEEKARMKIQAEQEAEARIRAEAEAKVRAKAEAEAKARAEAEAASQQAARAAAARKAEEERKKKDALADSADDSFKQFMKEEDGEDQQGDADYEDSANALAGAIGWNRKEIETKADSAVKQLTEAIGGKKVVKSLQGMMAGVR